MLTERVPVLAAVLRERRRSVALWTVAVASISAMYLAFWPAMGAGAEMEAFVANMPEALVTAMGYEGIGTAAGYLESTVYGLLAPILLLVMAIGAGARLLGGEEEDGTLELEVAHPVPRRRVVLERMAALVVSLLVATAAVLGVTLVLVPLLEMDIAAGAIVATTAGLAMLVLAFGLAALAVGAATGRRGVALAVPAAVAVITFVADAVAPLVGWGGWLEAASPFSWYLGADPLTTGWDPPGLALLGLLAVVAAVVAVQAFDRRDLGT
jgi:ABC-2 type transport system permease protein